MCDCKARPQFCANVHNAPRRRLVHREAPHRFPASPPLCWVGQDSSDTLRRDSLERNGPVWNPRLQPPRRRRRHKYVANAQSPENL